jgi:hypothetical protein
MRYALEKLVRTVSYRRASPQFEHVSPGFVRLPHAMCLSSTNGPFSPQDQRSPQLIIVMMTGKSSRPLAVSA